MSTIVRYSNGSTYTLVANKVETEKVQELGGQYHIPYSSIVGMMRLGLGVQRITVSGDALDMSACLWHDVVAISFDSGTSYQTVYFAGVPYTSDCWSGIYPYALSLLASPLKEQTAVRYPSSGYKWGNQSITGISQAGNVNAKPTIHYLAPLFYAPLSNTLVDLSGQSVTFTRTAPKVHGGVTYPINTPIFDWGLYLGSDTVQDVATWTPLAPLRNVIYCMGDSLTAAGQWEAQLISHLEATWEAVNLGISGNTTGQMLARFENVTAPGDGEYAVILGGINDVPVPTSAVDIEANLQAMYNAAYAAGLKVVAVTIIPFKGCIYWEWTSGLQAVVDTVNAWILNTATHVDYRVNAYAAMEDPATVDTLLPAYDSGDHLHLSAAGYIHLGDTIFAGATWVGTPVSELPILRTVAMQIKSRPIIGTNLVTNGDFETDISGWNDENGCTISHETGTPLVGTGSLKLLKTGSGLGDAYCFLETIIGHCYWVTCLAKSVETGTNSQLGAGTPVDCSADTRTLTHLFTATSTYTPISLNMQNGAVNGYLFVDSISCLDLTVLFNGNILTIWTAEKNKVTIEIANNLIKWTDDTTTVSLAFPTAAYMLGGVVGVIAIEDAAHAVTVAVHDTYYGSWYAATGTLAALRWPQLTLGVLNGSIANLIEYPYALTSAEYQALAYSSLSLLYNTLYIGNRYAGEIVKGSDKRLLNANGADISALLGGTDIAIGSAAVTIAQSQGLSARWYVEVKRTDI